MTELDPKKTVFGEQFDAEKEAVEDKKSAESAIIQDDKTVSLEENDEDMAKSINNKDDDIRQEASIEAEQESLPTEQSDTEVEEQPAIQVEAQPEVQVEEQEKEKDGAQPEKSEKSEPETTAELQDADVEETTDEPAIDYSKIELPPVDYSGYSKTELVETLELLVNCRPVNEIRNDVDRIKAQFYSKIKAESEKEKTKFLDNGGKVEEYIHVDPLEERIKYILEKFKEKKHESNKIQEAEKNENLKRKYEVIDKIKDLVNKEEAINKTYQDFRNLQNEWKSIGQVPQSALKELWDNYNHNVEIFYDYIKINKELRDLDLKKNLELKTALCEKAEALMLEANPVMAFNTLQEYHNQWREIGPVPVEVKNEIWERFKAATAKINKRHHDYFDTLKVEQHKNLEAKVALCEQIEQINEVEYKNFKEIEAAAEKVISVQQVWRTIGFVPKKQNNKIYQRFRNACDAFFEKKRFFYNENKELQQTNLHKKVEICEKAESLQNSTDWKATTEAFIQLQKEWKSIGAVPRKYSDKCWKRFRKACDVFFNRKAEHFNVVDASYEENLKAKQLIIEELQNFEAGEDDYEDFNRLKNIQNRWSEIGFVPFKQKEEINRKFKNLIHREFNKLKIDDDDKSLLQYKNKLEALKSDPQISRKIQNERDKMYTKIKQLENDIVLWENNIGFFTKSPNAEVMIHDVENKIENAKKTIKTLEEKIKIIDQSNLGE